MSESALPTEVRVDGEAVALRPATQKDRVRLKLPGAWEQVLVSVAPDSPLQAVGVDAKGRKQYRYSPAYEERQATAKFARVRALKARSAELTRELERRALVGDEEALVLLLIRRTGFRVGVDRDTKADVPAHGATQLVGKHVQIDGDVVSFDFVGKKGVRVSQDVEDALLARLLGERVTQEQERLFSVSDDAIRDYLKEMAGPEVKVKDLRTLLANELAETRMSELGVPRNSNELRKRRMAVGRAVAARLNNTPQVALASYIDPALFHGWELNVLEQPLDRSPKPRLSSLAETATRAPASAPQTIDVAL